MSSGARCSETDAFGLVSGRTSSVTTPHSYLFTRNLCVERRDVEEDAAFLVAHRALSVWYAC